VSEADEALQSADQALLLVEQGLLLLDGALLRGYLLLLLADCVDQHGCDLPVLHIFDLALFVVGDEQRLDLLDLFGTEADIFLSAVAPGECDRAQTADNIKPGRKCSQVSFVAEESEVTRLFFSSVFRLLQKANDSPDCVKTPSFYS
jgi:hypothetical protein